MEIKKLSNGFEYIEVMNDTASAKIALQGAHIFEYKVKGKEDLLWLSTESDFEYGKVIRGGIPICWPSFGMNNSTLPQHGFARVSCFQFEYLKEVDGRQTELLLSLEDTPESRKIWNYKFRLELKFILSDCLTLELLTINKDTKPFILTQAFHSYFQVSDIDAIVIKGLEGMQYYDTLKKKESLQEHSIKISEEFDNVYKGVAKRLELVDKEHSITIESKASFSTVIWNPWVEKSKKMSGMRDDAYREFVCIETANAFDDYKVLKAGACFLLGCKIF